MHLNLISDIFFLKNLVIGLSNVLYNSVIFFYMVVTLTFHFQISNFCYIQQKTEKNNFYFIFVNNTIFKKNTLQYQKKIIIVIEKFKLFIYFFFFCSWQRSPVVESQFKSAFNRHLFNHTFFRDYKCMWTIELFKIHFGLLCPSIKK
jgi:hypothetical protein